MKKFLSFLTTRSSIPWLLLALTLISYGLTIPFLNFFMDDWYLIWFKHTFGALDYPAYFALDRPLMGYFYVLANAILFDSESPIVWNIFGLLTRWLCTLALWQFLNTLWPKNLKQNTWVALLAAVFPGFTQHWIVVVYSFFYTCLAGLFFSFTLMIRALRSRKSFWLNYLLSIFIGFYAFAAAEFYFGLELVRPLIIWFILSESIPARKQRIWSTLKFWAPYLVIFVAFGFWRAFFFESMNHAVALTDQLSNSLWAVITQAIGKVIRAIVDSTVTAWTQILNLTAYPSSGKTPLVLLGIALVIFFGLKWWLRDFNRNLQNGQADKTDHWSIQSFWLAVVSIIVAVLPFWAADLEVSTLYPYDRFLLAYLPGSCLLVVGLINQFSRNHTLQVAFLSVLVAASAAFQLNLSMRYKNMANSQNELIWQLVWRVPGITPGTTFVAHDFPYQAYLSGPALGSQVNWIYSRGEQTDTRSVDYFFLFLGTPLQEVVEDFSPNHPIVYDFRTYQFKSTTNHVVTLSENNLGCLRVLDARLTPLNSVVYNYPKTMPDAANISNLSMIIDTGAQQTPPPHLFGNEPAHTWCYYFEKAELARQVGDYAKAYDLTRQANQLNFYPMDLSEWYPFIDSALHLGHLEEAAELSSRIILDGYLVKNGVCNTWQNYAGALPGDHPDIDFVQRQLTQMECD